VNPTRGGDYSADSVGDTDQISAAGRRTNISLGPWAPSRGLDTHSQSVIQEGTSKDTD